MRTLPLVSILMPVYNGILQIETSIKSLLWQTYSNWECIIVDDGSIDGTALFLNKIKDRRFKIIHLPKNRGRGYARQVCLNNASGDYIAYLDADDWYGPDKLYKQVLFLENNPDVALVSCGMLSYGKSCKVMRVRGKGDNVIRQFSIGTFPIMCAASMIRREVTIGIAYNTDLNTGEDVDFFSRCLKGKKYSALDEVLYYYSEFDSMSLQKMQKSSKSKFFQRKSLNNLCRCIYYYIVAPIIGMNIIVYSRGVKVTIMEAKKYEELTKSLCKVNLTCVMLK